MPQLKCSICGGTELNATGDGSLKCAYCGAIHTPEVVKQMLTEIKGQVEVIGKVEVDGVNTADKFTQNGQTFLNLGEWDKARAVFEKMINMFPEDYRGWWGMVLTVTHSLTWNPDLGKEYYEKAIKTATVSDSGDITRQFDEGQKNWLEKISQFVLKKDRVYGALREKGIIPAEGYFFLINLSKIYTYNAYIAYGSSLIWCKVEMDGIIKDNGEIIGKEVDCSGMKQRGLFTGNESIYDYDEGITITLHRGDKFADKKRMFDYCYGQKIVYISDDFSEVIFLNDLINIYKYISSEGKKFFQSGKIKSEKNDDIRHIEVITNTNKGCLDCYIATAVYGSYDAPEVITIRRFRDEVLMKSLAGRKFVTFYYKHSPYYAEKLKSYPIVNKFVKFLLDGIVKLIGGTRK
jgi:hypothetical protein